MADRFVGLPAEDFIRFDGPVLIVEPPEVYITPSRFNMMSMTAITIKAWIQLPVRGKLGLIFRPKKPSSHSITRITTIVHNMRFLLLNDLLNDLLDATWS
jgi:hypothetical protein